MKSSLLLGPIAALAALAMASAAHAGGARHGDHDATVAVDRDAGQARLVVVRRADDASDVRDGNRTRGDERDRRSRTQMRNNGGPFQGLQLVPTSLRPGESGYGWTYFSDPVSGQAVVISPEGQHYFSAGDGLRPIETSPGL